MKKLMIYSKRSLVVAVLLLGFSYAAIAQKHRHSEQESTSLAIFPDDYDDDSTLSTPKSYNDKGPGCLFALEIGLNASNYYFSQPGYVYNNGFTWAGRFGGVLGIALSRHFFIEPGIFAVVNGTNLTYNNYIPEHVYVYSGELPVNVQYKLGNARGNRFFFGVGGYVGYNFGGTNSNTTSSIYPTDIKIGTNKTDFIAPLDFGVGANVGYQLKNGLFFRARYQLGLANLTPDTNNDSRITSTSFGGQVGYFFRKAKGQHR